MAVIADEIHAVHPADVQAVSKVDDLHDPPIPSYWYLDLLTSGGQRRLTFLEGGARDDFYKKLVDAMAQ